MTFRAMTHGGLDPAPWWHGATLLPDKDPGTLSDRFATVFDPMHVESEHGNTVLSGVCVDASALYGVLDQVREFGLDLLDVESFPVVPAAFLPNIGQGKRGRRRLGPTRRDHRPPIAAVNRNAARWRLPIPRPRVSGRRNGSPRAEPRLGHK